jgi:hypothetical protein
MVTTDQDARVVLDALVAQIRRTLEYAPAGALFRKMRIGSPVKITCEPHVVPELDLRFCRTFVTMEFSVPDDVYADAAGLPEPAATLLASLPAGSYSKARLTALAAAFDQIDRDALTEIRLDPARGRPLAQHWSDNHETLQTRPGRAAVAHRGRRSLPS